MNTHGRWLSGVDVLRPDHSQCEPFTIRSSGVAISNDAIDRALIVDEMETPRRDRVVGPRLHGPSASGTGTSHARLTWRVGRHTAVYELRRKIAAITHADATLFPGRVARRRYFAPRYTSGINAPSQTKSGESLQTVERPSITISTSSPAIWREIPSASTKHRSEAVR